MDYFGAHSYNKPGVPGEDPDQLRRVVIIMSGSRLEFISAAERSSETYITRYFKPKQRLVADYQQDALGIFT